MALAFVSARQPTCPCDPYDGSYLSRICASSRGKNVETPSTMTSSQIYRLRWNHGKTIFCNVIGDVDLTYILNHTRNIMPLTTLSVIFVWYNAALIGIDSNNSAMMQPLWFDPGYNCQSHARCLHLFSTWMVQRFVWSQQMIGFLLIPQMHYVFPNAGLQNGIIWYRWEIVKRLAWSSKTMANFGLSALLLHSLSSYFVHNGCSKKVHQLADWTHFVGRWCLLWHSLIHRISTRANSKLAFRY